MVSDDRFRRAVPLHRLSSGISAQQRDRENTTGIPSGNRRTNVAKKDPMKKPARTGTHVNIAATIAAKANSQKLLSRPEWNPHGFPKDSSLK